MAREGAPFLLTAAVASALAYQFGYPLVSVLAAVIFVLLVLVFRDPPREIPASPLGIVSPVDGTVISVELADKGVLQGEAHRILIRISSLGTYTARSPTEGQVKDLRSVEGSRVADYQTHALWVRTDEGDDIVLQFHGYRFGLPPSSFIGIGERVGQGQRCAYLRLTRVAELHLPIETKILVEPGEALVAGTSLIGKLTHA